jgi:fibronectin-binding autotransporter adhesin
MKYIRLLTTSGMGLFIGFIAILMLGTPTTQAGIVRQLAFSARLKSAVSDIVVPDGTYDVTFSLYTGATDGFPLWTEIQSLAVTNGIISTSLGSVTPFPASVTFNGNSFYLGVKVGYDPEMRPRKQISSVPMVFNADTVDGAQAGTSANNVLQLDSSGNINIQGGATLGSALTVGGDINTSGGVVKVGGVTVCTFSGCTAATSSNNYIQNGTSIQIASLAIQPAVGGNIGAVIRANASQTANLQEWQDSTGSVLASISSSGVLALPANGLNVGSGQLHVTGTNVSIANALTVGSDINTTTGVLKVAGVTTCTTSGCTAASGSGYYIQNGTSIQSASFAVQPSAGGNIGAVIKANGSQSANLQEWQDSSGVALASISPTGLLTLPADGLAVGGTQLVASGGNVGIGASPTNAKLEVTQTVGSGSLSLTASGTGTTGLLWNSGTYGFIDYNTSSSSGVRYSALGPQIFGSNDNAVYGLSTFSEKMRLTAGGNLGIGTTTPQQAITLPSNNDVLAFEMATPGQPTVTCFTSGGSMTDGTYYYKIAARDGSGDTTPSAENSCTITGGGGSGSVTLSWSSVPGVVTGGAATYRVWRGTTPDGESAFQSASTSTSFTDTGAAGTAGSVSTVTSAYVNRIAGNATATSWLLAGKVGVGTAAPTEKLTVSGNINAMGANAVYVTANFNGSQAPFLQTWNRGGDTSCGADYRMSLYFGLKVTNVGTLSGSPCSQSVTAQPTLTTQNSSTPEFGIESYGFDRLRVLTHASGASFTEDQWTEAMSILPNGNVGIGTTAPTSQLSLHKTAVVTLGTTSTYPFEILTTSGGQIDFGADNSNAYIQSFNSKPLQLNNKGNNVLFNLHGGNVGIRTATPQQALTLASGRNFSIEIATPGAPTLTPSTSGGSMADGTYYYVIVAADSGGSVTVKGTEASTTITGGGGSGSVALSWSAITGAATYRIYRSTTSGTYTTPALIATGLTTTSSTDTLNAPTSGAPIANTTAMVAKISSGAVSWVNGGNLGIGTATPGEKLEVVGNILLSGGGTSFFLHEGTSGTCNDNTFTIGTTNCANAATDYMFTIKSDGTIGIGTASPTSLLTIVGGTINPHIEINQTTAPTIGTPSSCGTSPTATVTAGSTDANGKFTITAGSGSPGNCAAVITFNKTYTDPPKSIFLTSTTSTGPAKQIYVSAITATTFTVTLNTAPAASQANTWYYWIAK